ncbi:hypothetical protein [Streptomyces sp. NRRL S-378]|uniref:hypothetical protein n=1 Tax=Streptomyces sp. NRRL S-378 TaxID=1463904 RepID=UPI00131C480E|nr:hypothetical protein [Streptomyces sp. NRRL S-378]
MHSAVRIASAIVIAFSAAAFGHGTASAAPAGEDRPVLIRCNNPSSLSLADASGGDSLVRQLISVVSGDGDTNDGNLASGVITGEGGIADGGDASQSANENRCGASSDIDASTRIDNSQRVNNRRDLDIDNGPGLL